MPPPTSLTAVTIAPQGGASTPLTMLNVAYSNIAPETIASGTAYADAQSNAFTLPLATANPQVWGIFADSNFVYPNVGSSYGVYPVQGNAIAGSFASPITLTNNGYAISSNFAAPTITPPTVALTVINIPRLVQGYVYAGSYVANQAGLPTVYQSRIYRGWVVPIPAAPALSATVNCTAGTVTLTWTDTLALTLSTPVYVHIWRNGVKIARRNFNPKTYVDIPPALNVPVSYQVSYFYGNVDGNGNESGVLSAGTATLFWDGIGPLSNTQTVSCSTPCLCCNWTADSGPPQVAWTADSGPSACAWQIVKPCQC